MSILGEAAATRRRFAAGSRVDGVFVNGAPTDTAILATELPLSGEEMATLSEGERKRSPRKFLTAINTLRTLDQAAQTSADQVIVGGRTFEVRKLIRFTQILPHDGAICLELQEADV